MQRAIIIGDDFDPVPSAREAAAVTVDVAAVAPPGVPVGYLVAAPEEAPADLGVTPVALGAAGFTGAPGTTLVLPSEDGRVVVAVGVATPLTAAAVRDAAATFANVTASHGAVALAVPAGIDAAVAAAAAVEGIVLARYRWDVLKSAPTTVPLSTITIVSGDAAAAAGAQRGASFARAATVARDLANTPPAHLAATRIADLALELGPAAGLAVEVFDRDQLIAMGCGGIIAVNGGSDEPPRMVTLRYAPEGATAHLALVGKGIMYDSGGISLKPGDAVHATMKNDMSGAAAVLAAMLHLGDVGCPAAVTGYLMCTDNMPSGTAAKLGDVMTVRGGTTVEIINTDAEGRLVMADALVLAAESQPDAIVDIATLTGACMRALGEQVAGVMGNDRALVDQISAAGEVTDEPVWELPLERRYRRQLDSDVADIKNLGGANAGAITAALFLEEFVAGIPWAHIDIAGTAQSDQSAPWRPLGCTGFGTRLLLQLARDFTAPRP